MNGTVNTPRFVVGQCNTSSGEYDIDHGGWRSVGNARFADVQAMPIPLMVGHAWRGGDVVGSVVSLCRSRAGNIYCVASVDDDALPDVELFMSAGVASHHARTISSSRGTDYSTFDRCEVRHVALVLAPATNVAPVAVVTGELGSGYRRDLPVQYRRACDLAAGALRARRYRSAPTELRIADLDPTPATATEMTTLRRSEVDAMAMPAELTRASTGRTHRRENLGRVLTVR